MLRLWREMLDDGGFWPGELVAKMACGGTYMLIVCLAAHFAPFTIEAFFAALIAGAFIVLAVLIVAGIGVGVLSAIMVFMDRRAAAEAAEAALLRQATAGQEGAATARPAEDARASESAVPSGDGEPSPKELRCHDDP